MAAEFAQEEANHIAWIQGNLGEAAIPMPQVRHSIRNCSLRCGCAPGLHSGVPPCSDTTVFSCGPSRC